VGRADMLEMDTDVVNASPKVCVCVCVCVLVKYLQ